MRNTFFALIAVVAPLLSASQTFSIVTDQDSIFTKVSAFASTYFMTSHGNVAYQDVKKAYLHGEVTDYYKNKFADLNIPLSGSEVKGEVSPRSIVVTNPRPEVTERNTYDPRSPLEDNTQVSIEELNRKLTAFNNSRNTGYALEIAGVGLTGVGIAADSIEVAFIGAAFSLVGLIVNASAGAKLR